MADPESASNVAAAGIGQECLDHFLVFSEKHMDYLVSQYVEYYHRERPHQSLGNEVILKLPEVSWGAQNRPGRGALKPAIYEEF